MQIYTSTYRTEYSILSFPLLYASESDRLHLAKDRLLSAIIKTHV